MFGASIGKFGACVYLRFVGQVLAAGAYRRVIGLHATGTPVRAHKQRREFECERWSCAHARAR